MNDDSILYPDDASDESIKVLVKEIREKAYRAATMIKELKLQNQHLEERNKAVEAEVLELRQQLEVKTRDIEDIRENMKSVSAIDVGDRLLYFSPDEREALERQITELLARVSSHLR